MRILWFINTPSLAGNSDNASIIQGGWMSSLEKQLSNQDSIQLGIAYPGNQVASSTSSNGKAIYYSIPALQNEGILKGFLGRWRHVIEPGNDVKYFLSIIERFKPDLIHVFGSERHYGLLSSFTKVPVIIQIQGNLTECHQKWFSGLSYFEILRYCNKKNLILGYGIFHQYYLIKKRAAREKKILAQCRFIVGRTEWDKRIMKVFSPNSLYYHCDELMRDEFYTKLWKLPAGRSIILFSTLSPIVYKGLETVLKTATLLMGITGLDFEWHIAGVNGNEEIIRIIESAKGMKYKDNRVKFLGSLHPSKLANELANSNLYVHPSHIENSPNSVCEAMIIGVPIIATYAGGTPSILRNGEEGILVQDGDPYALAGAIISLSDSPESMISYSEKAREKALLRHNSERVVKRIVDIYRNVAYH